MDGTNEMEDSKSAATYKPENKKRLFIPISFKMITITSLIVVASLTSVAIAASYFFRGDNEVRALEDTLRESALISGKVKSDLFSVAEKCRQTMSKTVEENAKSSKKESVLIYGDFLFKRDPGIYYMGVLKKGDKLPFIELKNQAAGAIALADFATQVKNYSDLIDKAFKGDEVLMNPSAWFNEAVVGMAVPFEIIEGKESVLIVFFAMDRLIESIRTKGVVNSYIVSGTGDVIVHYDTAIARSKSNLSDIPIVKMMMTNPNPNGQTLFTDEKGEKSLGAFQRIGFTDSAVISTVPEKVVFASVNKIQRIILFITLIALGVAVILIYIFSATITSPLKGLMDAARYIQKGYFDVEVPEYTRDEIGMLGESFTEMAKGLSEREKMKDAFGKFVNKEIAELVLQDAIKLGGERKDVAVFFSDIRAFTSMSEKMLPEEVVEFLNQYMSLMVGCVNETNGVVDKFIGDAIMAVWGAPVSHGNDTENAVNTALLMRKALIEFNKNRGTAGNPRIHIGIGINTGPVLAGQIGSQERMEYTVIGDAVNLASRIEALNKPFATDILISEDSCNLVKKIFNVQPMKKIRVKGKKEPQQIYAVLGRKDDPACPKTLTAMRMIAGIDAPKAGSDIDSDSIYESTEVKYEILD